MGLQKIDPCRIIKIEALELPKLFEEDEGIYEMRYANKPDEYQTFDIIDLKKELESINELTSRAEFILDHLQNFKRVYINLNTGEITI
jgi:hypothetical protein